MIKKIIAIASVFSLVILSLTACAGKKDSSSASTTAASSSTAQ